MYLEKVKEKSIGNFKLILFYTLMSQVLIFLRVKLMAKNITGHYNVDGYLVAILAATYIAEIIAEGLLVSLVPVFQKIKSEEGDEARFRFVNNLVNIMLIVSITMLFIGLIFAPYIVDWYNKDLVGAEFLDAVKLFRMALPMLFFILVRPVYLAYLQSNHGFKAGAKGGMLMNGVYFLYLFLFSRFGIRGLVIAGVLAHGSYFLVIPGIMKGQGYKYERRLDFKDINLSRLAKLFMPMVVYILVMRLEAKIDVFFSSKIGNVYGVLGNANYMIGFIITVIIQVIITISYPLLSETFINKDEESHKAILNTGSRVITTILTPVMVVTLLFAGPLTNLFFGNGRALFFKRMILDGMALEHTVISVRYLGISIIFIGLNLLIVRALFSRHDILGPAVIGLMTLGLNFVLGQLLINRIGELGMALSKGVSNIFLFILLYLRLNRKKETLDSRGLGLNILKSLVLSIPVSLIIYVAYRLGGRTDLGLIIGFIISTFVYYNLYDKVEF